MHQDHVFYSSVDPSEGQKRFFLKGLDGLRALAVGTVLVYHLWPGILPGGMIGVDIFFVISGYLITALLLREGAYTGKMNIVQFWVRRARRLIPAIVVLVATVGTLSLFVGGDAKVGLGRQVLGAFTFSSNWLYIASGNDYFAQTTPELFTNFWSLAVEEQFYIFWPVVLVLVFMFTRRWTQRLIVPAVLSFVSLLLAIILTLTGAGVSRVYYGTDTHIFGLMLGVLLALLIPWSMYPPADKRLFPLVGFGEGLAGVIRAAAGWVSVFLLLVLAFVLNDKSGFFMPWGLLLASILAVGVIQALLADVHNPAADLLRSVLNFPVFVWVGRRSYGIYLWHWPLHVLVHYIFGAHAGSWVQWLVLVLTFVVAGLSYMFVEEPIRKNGFGGAIDLWINATRSNAKVPATAGAVALVLGFAGTGAAIATAPSMTEAESVVAQGSSSGGSVQISGSSSQDDGAQPDSSAPADSDSADSDRSEPASTSIIGDSVTVASSQALLAKIPYASVDGEVSRTLVRELPAIAQMASQKNLGEIVVVSLSTNSTMTSAQLEELLGYVKQGHDNGKLVLVTGAAPANLTWVAQSNAVITEFAKAHPDDVYVADWASVAKAHPEYLVSDGVHPQATGQQAYAQVIFEQVSKAQTALGHKASAN